jgi:hypothetical protein
VEETVVTICIAVSRADMVGENDTGPQRERERDREREAETVYARRKLGETQGGEQQDSQ